MSKKSKLLFEDNEWTFDKLRRTEEACHEIAVKELKLDLYPNSIEIIDTDQMLDLYSSTGLPVYYSHWSFGRRFLMDQQSYRKGHSGLAYEIIVNTNPAISYLMADNTMTMQALVIAHAACGHNHVFKSNYMFQQYTQADSILDYLQFAKNYITECETKYGVKAVEDTLDAAHSLMDYGVDRYKKPGKLSREKEQARQAEREAYVQSQANELWRTIPSKHKDQDVKSKVFPSEPESNILYFIEKYSPKLESWQREIVRIVRKIAQYFYPQRYTKVINEGWASFTHYYIMTRLWEQGRITDGHYMEFIHSHSSVLRQLPYDHPYYSGYNPYALGFDIFTDIRRICTEPTDEDREYFPDMVGRDWLETCHDAVANYRDETFIQQFLSPTVMRKWGLFEITNNERDSFITVTGIQNQRGYDRIRRSLAEQYSGGTPDIRIVNANLQGNRELNLLYTPHHRSKLDERSSAAVLAYIEYLWGYPVSLDDGAGDAQEELLYTSGFYVY
jgi:spore cortex formation protein SpoVR/YcgB (stage V sporulation)